MALRCASTQTPASMHASHGDLVPAWVLSREREAPRGLNSTTGGVTTPQGHVLSPWRGMSHGTQEPACAWPWASQDCSQMDSRPVHGLQCYVPCGHPRGPRRQGQGRVEDWDVTSGAGIHESRAAPWAVPTVSLTFSSNIPAWGLRACPPRRGTAIPPVSPGVRPASMPVTLKLGASEGTLGRPEAPAQAPLSWRPHITPASAHPPCLFPPSPVTPRNPLCELIL